MSKTQILTMLTHIYVPCGSQHRYVCETFESFSVIVDELARWKVNLLQRQDDVDHHVRLLLHERAILWDTLNSTADTLANIKAAFDPLGTQVCKAFRVGVARGSGLITCDFPDFKSYGHFKWILILHPNHHFASEMTLCV